MYYINNNRFGKERMERAKSSKRIINLLLQATLFTANSLTLEEIIDKTGLSKSTIKNRLALKEVSQLLKVEKESKYYIYSLDIDKLTQ